MATDRTAPRLVGGCRSDFELFVPESDIVVIGGPGGGGTLKADRKVDSSRRAELIKLVRGGEHVELSIRARVFRQKDGQPNKRFLRFKPEKLADVAASFVSKPFLLDHNKWEQSARMGTISASEYEEQGHGWLAILQTIQVVKPGAVISVLDGTLDRFSIGWSATGPVICTAHKVDVRSRNRCSCWPGDLVEVDGKKEIAEYEFQSAEGDETSGVNGPAASGTRIEDVRQALAAELGIERPDERERHEPMIFTRLAAILGITALSSATDEESAVQAVEGLKRGKLAAEQERDTARAELATAKKDKKDAEAKTLSTQVDAVIVTAYREGKLRMGRDEDGEATPSKREARLRKIAETDGLAALNAEIEELPVVVPLGKRQLDDHDRVDDDEVDDGSALSSAARQLGFKPKELAAHAAGSETTQDNDDGEED